MLHFLTDEFKQRNLLIFFAAGHDTTAGSLGYVLYYLSTHLDIQEKARKEVLEILGDNDQDVYPTTEQIKKMKYLNQIIKEVKNSFFFF